MSETHFVLRHLLARERWALQLLQRARSTSLPRHTSFEYKYAQVVAKRTGALLDEMIEELLE